MFKKFNSESREATLIQQNVEQALRRLFKGSILDNAILEGVKLDTGENTVEHRLLRKIRGYIVIRVNAASDIYEIKSDDKTITLSASAPCTVSLLIF